MIVFTPEGPPPSQLPVATNALVLPGFFEAMRIPLRAGRLFNESDTKGTPGVVIINETMARKYYGNANPVGRKFKWGPPDSPVPLKEIVGVVADVKHRTLDEEPSPAVYHAIMQQDTGQIVRMYRGLSYVVRARMAPASLAASIRTAVRGVDPKLVVLNVLPMDTIVGDTIATRKFNATLLGLVRGAGARARGHRCVRRASVFGDSTQTRDGNSHRDRGDVVGHDPAHRRSGGGSRGHRRRDRPGGRLCAHAGDSRAALQHRSARRVTFAASAAGIALDRGVVELLAGATGVAHRSYHRDASGVDRRFLMHPLRSALGHPGRGVAPALAGDHAGKLHSNDSALRLADRVWSRC